jgi:hypothetical protein
MSANNNCPDRDDLFNRALKIPVETIALTAPG